MPTWSWPLVLLPIFTVRISAQPTPAQVEICARRKAANVSDSALRTCGTKWAVKNVGVVVEHWEVHELNFYWDAGCTYKLPWVETFESSILGNYAGNVGRMAFDGNLDTKWSAHCRYLMGGCIPWEEHVGIDTTGFAPVAMDSASPYASVRCVRIWQSFNQTRHTTRIALVTWENETAEGYHVVGTYDDLTGGAWQKRPAAEHGLWRVWNHAPTARPWQVAEFVFYSDVFCTTPESGAVISSRPFYSARDSGCVERKRCDYYHPIFARDGVTADGQMYPEPLPSRWIAGCDEWEGCESDAAWIGLDFGQHPVTVRCLRIFQPTHEGFPNWGHPTYSSSLLLQLWDGVRWDDSAIYSDLTHGAWYETLPESRTAWAITNYDRMPGAWQVYEVGFYGSAECGNSEALEHVPFVSAIDSNPELDFDEQQLECRTSPGSCAELAVDTNPDTAWRSSCSPCGQFDAWVGLRLRGKGKDVRCFRLLQSSEKEHLSAAVQLGYWDGKGWKRSRLEVAVGGGTWNFRPAAPGTMWRFFGDSATTLPWTLIGFQVYTDTNCNAELQATSMSSGSKEGQEVSQAFDDNDETYWEASCQPPKTGMQGCREGSAWIGVQSSLEQISVGCFRVFQHHQRDRQMSMASVQEWDGVAWVTSTQYPIFKELGFGWQMLPGMRGSKWRLTAHPTLEMAGFGVTELEFYRSSDCHGAALEVGLPNIMPICSGHSSAYDVVAATGYTAHLVEIGESAQNTPHLAFDKNIATFWADITSSQSWIGLDFTVQAVDVQCAKLAMAGVRSLQAPQAEIQAWDGTQWTTYAVAASPWKTALQYPLPTIGGVGFQRRPMLSHSMWRLQNDHQMIGWDVMEVQFYTYMDCSGDIVRGTAIGSIPKVQTMFMTREHHIPALAFDNDVDTGWSADCPQGCGPSKAWIGLDTGSMVFVRCIRIFQTGQRDTQAASVALAFWDGEQWDVTAQYGGLGGDTWNLRPAAPDTMWRLTFMKPAGLCPGHGRGLFSRSWGVSELRFYSDDDCRSQLPGLEDGAVVIASGTRKRSMKTIAAKSSFHPLNAFDDDLDSHWAAQCGNELNTDAAQCAAGLEWIGLDFTRVKDGGAQDVRCFRIHQNRASGRECCDPAEEVILERWNGNQWKTTSWRHQPLTKPTVHIEGVFSRLGTCKSIGPSGVGQIVWKGRASELVEARKRRQSDQCVVPKAASVRLLVEPLCDKHSACAEAGYTGQCCPMDAASGLSRCCCDFLMSDKVFKDEYDKDVNRQPLATHPLWGLEFAIIRSVFVLPILGAIVAILVYILANVQEPPRGCWYMPFMAICEPLQSWLKSELIIPSSVAWFVQRRKGASAWEMRFKFLAWLAVGFLGGGAVIWLMISYLISEFFIKITVLMSLVMNLVRSPYKPGDFMDEQRMILMLRNSVTKARSLNFGSVGDVAEKFAVACVAFVLYVGRGIFDFVLMRFSLLAIGTADDKISVAEILYYFPETPLTTRAMLDLIHDGVGLSGQSFEEAATWLFVGMPRCEGPVVLFSGMWLVAVTLLLVRWLNYDFFGLFVASKQVVTLTRPVFQKSLGLGFVEGFQGGLFLFMQCIMLLFTRALKLVNPLEKANQQWNCPYDYDAMSTIIGRVFLIVAAALALGVTFLCANGHFMGQDYIVGEFSRWIGMDLSRLDPDGTGVEGKMIRFDTFLAMIPTTFGVWIDSWNVRGFLIHERADVYADQLHVPFPCQVCGEAHAPYTEVMSATGRQLSLAWQLIPAGVLVGKACEYLNNPPLLYCGSALRCYNHNKHMKHTLEGVPKKLNSSQATVVWGSLFIAILKDQFLPFLLRLSCAATYGVLVYYAITIDEQTMESKSRECFTMLIILAAARAALEFVFPALVLLLWGSSLACLPGEQKIKPVAGDSEATTRKVWLAGQVVNGVLSGSAVTLHLLVEDPWELGGEFAIGLGVAAGIIDSVMTLCIGLMLGTVQGKRLYVAAALVLHLLAVAACITWLISKGMAFHFRTIIGTCVGFVLVFVSFTAFRPPNVLQGRNASPSRLVPLLVFPRLSCGPIGIWAGVSGAGLAREDLYQWLGQYGGLATTLVWGLMVGVLFSLAIDSLMDSKAAHFAVPAGSIVAFAVQLLWHWLPAVVAGTLVACCLGALQESSVHRAVMDEAIAVSPCAPKSPDFDDSDEPNSTLPTLCPVSVTVTPRNDIASLKVQQIVDLGFAEADTHRASQKALTVAGDTSTSLVLADLTPTSRTKSDSGFTIQPADQSPIASQTWSRPPRHQQGRPRFPKKHTLADRAINNAPWATGHSWAPPAQSYTIRASPSTQSPEASQRQASVVRVAPRRLSSQSAAAREQNI